MAHVRHVFAVAGLDRAAHRRREAAWIEARLRDPATRVVRLWRGQIAVEGERDPRAVLHTVAEARALLARAPGPVFLGEAGGRAYFAVEDDASDPPPGRYEHLRSVGARLERREAALLAHARAMLLWHRSHRYCAACGHPSESAEAGHLRRCTNPACGAQHFPRLDPAIIVLVTRGESCLLGRQASWPPNTYSTLAGFVEPGESLEDAVRREVFEEAGVRVAAVRYHSSQPWPSPPRSCSASTPAPGTQCCA